MKYKLSDIMDLIGGGTPKTSVPDYWCGDIPWLSVKDFNNDSRYVYSTEKSITLKGLENSSTKLLRRNDLIVSARGTVGEIAMIPFPMAFNQSCYGLRAKETIVDPVFLYYLVKHNVYVLKKNTHGSVFDTITRATFDGITVDIPEKTIQIKIANFLSLLDDNIELNTQINNNLLQQALVLFEHTFITENYYADELPLYDFAEYINGAAFKPDELEDTGLPVIKIAELKTGVTDSTRFFSGNKGEKYLVFNKDILFSWSGNPETSIDIFIWSNGDGILNQHTFNVKSKFDCPWFTYLMLKYYKPEFTHIASNKQTTGLGHVTATDLKRLTFPFNKAKMQAFESNITPTMDLLYSILLENKQLSQLRDTLLPKFMSGELDVSNIEL